MAEFLFLGLEVLFGVRTGLDFARHSLDNFNAGALQGLDLLGIVREQSHLVYAERLEHLADQRDFVQLNLALLKL